MKKIYPLVCFSILYNIAIAQQWNSYHPFAGFDINAVDIPGPGHIVLGGGRLANDSIQIMFTSHDYGLTWLENSHDGLASWNKSVAFADDSNGFGVGYLGRIIKTDDGGDNWGYSVYPIIRNFNKIVNVTPQIYYAVGGKEANDSMQTIVKTTDGGTNWNVIYDTAGTWLKSVYFINTLKGFAVGDSGVILATTNGGTSWAAVTPPVQRNFNAITFINADTGFIAGGNGTGTVHRTILRTNDGGSNWTVALDATGGMLNDISFADSTVGYTVGDSSTVLKTADGGLSWTPVQVSLLLTGGETYRGVKFYNRNFGVVGGKAGVLYVYTNAPQPVVNTVYAEYIDSVKYRLHAGINTYNMPAEYYFQYSTDSLFLSQQSSNVQNITSNTFADCSTVIQGLTPSTKYFYRLVLHTLSGNHFIDTLSFYTYVPHYTVETDTASSISLTSAQLNGKLKVSAGAVSPYFVCSPNLNFSFSPQIQTLPATISDTLLHTVSAYILNLQPHTTYYYTLIGGPVTGDTLSFTTTDPGYLFGVDTASSITETTATISGHVENLPHLTNLFFEYGTNYNFTDTIVSLPATINDTAYHSVSANLTALVPYTTYYYRLRGNTSNGTYYSNAASFFTNYDHYIVQTLPAQTLTFSSAVFKGSVDKFLAPAQLSFEYSTNQFNLYNGLIIFCSPGSISDSVQHDVTGSVTNLLPGTTYYYRLKAVTSLGTFYGHAQAFTTPLPYTYFRTEPATNVTNNSAQLNGSIAGILAQAYISFEYSSTGAFVNQFQSVFIGNINDTATHRFNTNLTGLSAGHIYYYRVHANIAGADFYGETRQLYAGNSEIPNWDFQYWQADTFKLPDAWNIAGDGYAQVPGHNGSHALRLSGQSFALLGIMEDSRKNGSNGPGFFGGVPLAGRPDSVSVYANVSFAPGDTGMMLVYLHKDTTSLAFEMFKLAGNSGGAFTKFTFPISYPSGLAPDSVVIAFIPSNLDGHNSDPNDYMELDDISFSPGQMQVYNGDFENWFDFPHNTLLNWGYNKHILVNQSTANAPYLLNQTLFNPPGDYAVELRNIYAYGMWWLSELATSNNFLNDQPTGFAVNTRHDHLNGYYKWFPVNGDTLDIQVQMRSNGQQIGGGWLMQTDSVTEFTPLDIPISYSNLLTFPDEVLINIRSGTKPARGPSRLILDKLSFDGFTGIDEPRFQAFDNNGVKVYPNPSSGLMTLEISEAMNNESVIQIYNLNGEKQKELRVAAGESKVSFTVADMEAGFYLLRLVTGNKVYNNKIVVVK